MAIAPGADAALVRRLRERDRSAWGEVYAEYGPRLRPFAYRLTGNPHDADDLVQETFVRALPRLDRLDPEKVELGPYLFTTLRNLFLQSVERGRRAEAFADVPEPTTPAPIEDDPERSTLLHRQQEEVRLANAKLAPRQRLVLALRELEDRSYAEIGAVVGLKENAVAQLISRARESLRMELRLAEVDGSRLPEECRHFLPLLSRHLDGHLAGKQLEETLGHLESCERCQDALLAMREAQRRYRTLLPPFPAGDEQQERIDAELTSAHYWAGRRSWLRAHALLAAGATALLVAGAGGVGAAVLVTKGEGSGHKPRSVALAPAAASTEEVLLTTTEVPATTKQTSAAEQAKTKPPTAKPQKKNDNEKTTKAATTTTSKEKAETTEKPHVAPATTTPADRTAPTVTILSHPAAQTTSGDASFSFRASERAAFECRLGGAGFHVCSSPAAYHDLGIGDHSFAVRARDQAGNTGSAASFRWTIQPPPDTTPPTTTIVSASPSGGDVTFEFTSSEPGSTFACSLDGAAFEGCTSPRAYSGLAPGDHSFAVRATDPAGNVGAPATHEWTIAQPLPDLVVSFLGETSFTVTNVGNAAAGPFVVTVTLVGTFSFSGLGAGQSQTRVWSACRVGTLNAIADRGRTVAESNEDNNTRSIVSDC
jgi:RNA polymerase sigma factor (sigma-70 family)